MKDLLENLNHDQKMELLKKLSEEIYSDYYNATFDEKDLGFQLKNFNTNEKTHFIINTLKQKEAWLEEYVESIDIFEAVDEALEAEDPDDALIKLWLLFGTWKDNPTYKDVKYFGLFKS